MIGFLSPQSADDSKNFTVSFLQGLKETGYVEGQNVAFEYRYAENLGCRYLQPISSAAGWRATAQERAGGRYPAGGEGGNVKPC